MEKSSVKKIIISSIVFLLIVVATFSVILKNNELSNIILIVKTVKMPYLFLGIGSMSLFVLFEGINTKRILNILGNQCGFFCGIKYAAIGFFFSSITPFASGGQPMEIYFMNKDGIDISRATLVLTIELASYQLVTIGMAIVGYAYQFDFINTINPGIKTLLTIGVFLNALVLTFTLLAIFSKKVVYKIINGILWVMIKIGIKREERLKRSAYNMVKRYRSGVGIIKENKKKMLYTVGCTCIQIIGLHSVTYFAYRAFGLTEYSYLTIVALQAVLYVAVSAIPLPGSVGASEGGFLLLLKPIFTAPLVKSGMLLSRGISFYLTLMVTGGSILFIQIIEKIKRKSKTK